MTDNTAFVSFIALTVDQSTSIKEVVSRYLDTPEPSDTAREMLMMCASHISMLTMIVRRLSEDNMMAVDQMEKLIRSVEDIEGD